MSKRLYIFIFFIALVLATRAKEYNISNNIVFCTGDCSGLHELMAILPCPKTNQYQTVISSDTREGALLEIQELDMNYIKYYLDKHSSWANADTIIFSHNFTIDLRAYNARLDTIREIYPYDSALPIFRQYTASRHEYIDTTNIYINHVSDSLWSASENIIEYARHCYLFVANNFNYLNPNTGLHALDDIISAGGGDCGNLSSIFVTLLRHRQIPARHVVTIRPDGSTHIWAEFYLERYGWAPVDVTYKHNSPAGDYFGRYDGNGIILGFDICYSIKDISDKTVCLPLLQTYAHWYNYNEGGCENLKGIHKITASLFNRPQK